jgi:hypothetical protein
VCLPPRVGTTQRAALENSTTFENSGFHCGVNHIFALLRCYAAQIHSFRRFGTTYAIHFQGPAVQEVSGKPIRLIFMVKWSNRRFGKTYPSHFYGQAVKDTFRNNITVQFSGSSSSRDGSAKPIRPIFIVTQSKRRFGTTYPSHFQGPAVQQTFQENLSVSLLWPSGPGDVSGLSIRPISMVKQSKRRLGTTYPFNFQGPAVEEKVRQNLSVPFLRSSNPRDVSVKLIGGPIFKV